MLEKKMNGNHKHHNHCIFDTCVHNSISIVKLSMHINIYIVVLIKPIYIFQTPEFFIIGILVGRNDRAQVLAVCITLSALKLNSRGLYRITTRGIASELVKTLRTLPKVT